MISRKYSVEEFNYIAKAIVYLWYAYWYGITSTAMPLYDDYDDSPDIKSVKDAIESYMSTLFLTGREFTAKNDILKVNILHNEEVPDNGLIDFFLWLADNLNEALDDNQDIPVEAIPAIARSIYSDNEGNTVNRERLATLVSSYMEQLADAIQEEHTHEQDAMPDGDGKSFDDQGLAQERFKTFCVNSIFEYYTLPAEPTIVSFQDTTLRALDH